MPNGKTHLIAGTVCGAVASVCIQTKLNKKDQIDLGHLLLLSGAGLSSGRLPDILEPPLNPNHRAFFHSFVFGAVLMMALAKLWNMLKEKTSHQFEQRDVLKGNNLLISILIVLGFVVLLHLFMDGFTKKGLPLI